MIEATVAMAAMAGLFVVFGALRLAERGGEGEGCAGCSGSCEGTDECSAFGSDVEPGRVDAPRPGPSRHNEQAKGLGGAL